MTTKMSDISSKKRDISYTDFANGTLDSLTWYDLLPGDPVYVRGENDLRSATEIADALLLGEFIENLPLIDILAAKLLNGCESVSGYENWTELAFRLSQTMAANLTASGSRAVRMHVQRLNYYLQAIIDESIDIEGADLVMAETILDGSKPWDYLKRADGEWWISSDETNIHHQVDGLACEHRRMGLPTQIDSLPDGNLVFGSIYTNVAMLTDGKRWYGIEHDAPIVLVFEHAGQRYFIDHFCRIWEDQTRRLVVTVPRPQVHFARYFDGVLYVLDNMDFGHITLVHMDDGMIIRQPVLPVQVCNDMVVAGAAIYLIDKQQGSVFKFNRDWRFERRVLRFGRGPLRLQDPVSLREHDGCLLVVSWLTSKLTEIKLF